MEYVTDGNCEQPEENKPNHNRNSLWLMDISSNNASDNMTGNYGNADQKYKGYLHFLYAPE